MKRIALSHLVEQSIDRTWTEFAADHPYLAAMLDRDVLLADAQRALSSDPAFVDAVARAQIAGVTYETLADIVDRYIEPWIARRLKW
jgi:hypothetical protein